jgi:hypothetical protein
MPTTPSTPGSLGAIDGDDDHPGRVRGPQGRGRRAHIPGGEHTRVRPRAGRPPGRGPLGRASPAGRAARIGASWLGPNWALARCSARADSLPGTSTPATSRVERTPTGRPLAAPTTMRCATWCSLMSCTARSSTSSSLMASASLDAVDAVLDHRPSEVAHRRVGRAGQDAGVHGVGDGRVPGVGHAGGQAGAGRWARSSS